MRAAVLGLLACARALVPPLRRTISPTTTCFAATSRRRLGASGASAFAAALAARPAFAETVASAAALSDVAFYATYPYARAADVVPFVEAVAPRGDADAVLRALEVFGERYPMFAIGPVKGAIVDDVVAARRPRRVVEVGTFLGYSAVRIARALAPGATMVCVEGNPEFAATARRVVARAGLGGVVDVVVGVAADAVPDVAAAVGGAADLVFLDHCKECYAPDLARLEAAGLVVPGTVVVADNVVYPGAPGYLEKVARPAYETVLRDAPYESRGWETKWKAVDDAMSVSTKLPP